MGDALNGAAREVWDQIVGAVTDPGPWTLVILLAIAVVIIAVFIRGKLASPWILLPVAAYAGYWGWQHYIR